MRRMKAPSQDPEFNAEVVKLLLQVAWADDVLEPKEREFVQKVGRAWQVPDAVMADLLAHLDKGKPLPQPNLYLLRQRADAVIEAAEALIAADGAISAEEKDFVGMIEHLLGKS